MNNTGFHLPHNAILPEEVKFILSLIDVTKEYYLYDDLKAMMFEEEIKQGRFKEFHPGMYRNFMEDRRLNEIYNQILSGEKKYEDVKREPYSPKKNLNGCWNEQSRDYFEFIAFTGLMPSYYKGKAIENEKRYYIGQTLKDYKAGKIDYKDVLFKMKFRNASKNYDNIEQYNVRNRPFVVAIKVLNILKNKGYKTIDGDSLSFIIRSIKNEDDLLKQEFIREIKPIDFSTWDQSARKEVGRGTTFLKRHLSDELGVELYSSQSTVFNLETFNIDNYKFKDKAVFIGDIYGEFEVTPLFIKCLANPLKIRNDELKQSLIDLNLIKDNVSNYDFNVDTDLMDRNLVLQATSDEIVEEIEYSTRIEATDLYAEGYDIARSGNGTAYEEFLYNFLKNKFGENNVTYLGANTVGQRLSDIVLDIKLQNDDIKTKVRIIIESKSGSAIRAFDERKEKDDIINTLADRRLSQEYDGIWYMVVDSDKIPSIDRHGGFRENNNQVSFKQKLLRIQSAVMPATAKLTMVTAFSYSEFMKFIDSINYNNNIEYMTKIQAPDFWTWSNKFIETSYVTIRA